MWSLIQINRNFRKAVAQKDEILLMASKVALLNFQNYGELSPSEIESLKKSWGEM